MIKEKTVEININNSLYAHSFDTAHQIHYREFKKVEDLISGQIETAKAYRKQLAALSNRDDLPRSYSTISVFGDRGVGKTSFLLSLKKHYEDNKGIKILPIVDPTQIEEKGHIFLTIVALIDEIVMDTLREKAKEAEKKGGDADEFLEKKRSWEFGKSKLARAIPSLDHVGLTYEEPQWQQDEYVMTRGMESVSDAFHLERNFHKLVNEALGIIGMDAFLLMFDDIDVDFRRGWTVLETIRKYLTTPQLIVVLSGDLELYSKNVRKQQWNNFGKALLKNEVDTDSTVMSRYTGMVNKLEGQYLMKILKSENRVFLQSIYDSIYTYGTNYEIEDKNKISILDQYRKIFNLYGICGNLSVDLYTNFLLSCSVRTQIHFLKNAEEAKEESILASINAFISRIYAQGVKIDTATNAKNFNVQLLHYLVENKLVEEAYQLLPTFDNADINSVMAGFNFIFAQLIKRNPFLIFDYWARISFTRDRVATLGYGNDIENPVSNFCYFSGAYRSRNLRSIIGNGIAFLKSKGLKYNGAGNLEILGFANGRKELNSRIDTVLQGRKICQILGFLPLLSLASSTSNSHTLVYSIYGLLANIGELLNSSDEAMFEVLAESAQPRSYQSQDQSSETSDEAVASADMTFDGDALKLLADAMCNWRKNYIERNFVCGAQMFGRISTRLYFALRNIASANINRKLGSQMDFMVMALFNASMIEEAKEFCPEIYNGININNVVSSSDVLIKNVQYAARKINIENDLPFTKWVMACPLLMPFVKEQEELKYFIDIDGSTRLSEVLALSENLPLLLDKIAIKLSNRLKFSFAANKKQEIIDMINDRLNVYTVYEDKNENNALEELELLFNNVNRGSVRQIREQCSLWSGKLELKKP